MVIGKKHYTQYLYPALRSLKISTEDAQRISQEFLMIVRNTPRGHFWKLDASFFDFEETVDILAEKNKIPREEALAQIVDNPELLFRTRGVVMPGERSAADIARGKEVRMAQARQRNTGIPTARDIFRDAAYHILKHSELPGNNAEIAGHKVHSIKVMLQQKKIENIGEFTKTIGRPLGWINVLVAFGLATKESSRDRAVPAHSEAIVSRLKKFGEPVPPLE